MNIEKYLEGHSPEYRKLIEQLVGLAQTELSYCNEKNTPHVCAATSTAEGREEVILKIVRICGKTSMSVSEAIAQIERELNPIHPDSY